jgi:hypothetical protein
VCIIGRFGTVRLWGLWALQVVGPYVHRMGDGRETPYGIEVCTWEWDMAGLKHAA